MGPANAGPIFIREFLMALETVEPQDATQVRLSSSAAQALWRGLRGCCPACGEGRMFRAYLKVADRCPHCGEELYHHRADDFPAYLVIVIVGHILVPIILVVETEIAPAIWVSMTLWPSLALALTLGLLQPVKGAVVAIQWYGGMHGFEEAKKARALAATIVDAD
jgi:uncharacterized protein (DUF983 family)